MIFFFLYVLTLRFLEKDINDLIKHNGTKQPFKINSKEKTLMRSRATLPQAALLHHL